MIGKRFPIENMEIISVAHYCVAVLEQEKVEDLGDNLGLYYSRQVQWETEGEFERLVPILVYRDEVGGTWIGQSYNLIVKDNIIEKLEWV